MSLLSTTFCGLDLDNPIVVASCPATETVENILKCADNGAGAVITKSICDYEERLFQRGARRTHVDSRGIWATSTFRRETLSSSAGLDLVNKSSTTISIPIIASVAARDLDPEHWLPLCRDLQDAGSAMLQLDLFYLPQPVCSGPSVEGLKKLFSVLKEEMAIPIMPKLNIQIPAYLATTEPFVRNVCAFSLLDSIRVPCPPELLGTNRAAYRYVRNIGSSSVFGRWQLPLAQHYTFILARLGKLPICAGGGANNARDALELIMLGASLVQFATAILLNGYGFIGKLVMDLDRHLRDSGYATLTEATGLVAKQQRTDLEGAEPVFYPVTAAVDNDKCVMCESCLSIAFCSAITLQNGNIWINADECDGCGLCANLCDEGAIDLVGEV